MKQIPIFSKLYHLSSLLQTVISPNSQPTAFLDTPVDMRLSQLSVTTSLVTSALATNLYVSSYAGTISSLVLDQSPTNGYSLTTITSNNGSSPNPSWLTLDLKNDIIYCVDEGLSVPNGSISAYTNSASGKLTLIDRHETISGPVSTVTYNQGKALVAAHYSGSSITTWSITTTGSLLPLQSYTFTLASPGPNPSRQEAPHPHEAILDPTDQFIIIPDLGSDFLRIFLINTTSSLLTEQTPFSVPAGSGPRHGVFLSSNSDNSNEAGGNIETYFFLTSELANTVTSYHVTYTPTTLQFTEIFTSSIYGNATAPAGAAAAEIVLSPDAQYILTSSRNDSLYNITLPNTTTPIPSDTLQTWKIDPLTGTLEFIQLTAAGGRFPRQFSINQNGTLVAVGLQSDGRVVVLERDVETGLVGNVLADVGVEGEVTSVIWDE